MAANEFDARCVHQGTHSAWLIKNKGEGAKASWFSRTTKRYFTIDFNTQIFFYAHSETQKTVSQPVRFKDIVSADQLPTTSSSKGDSYGFSVLTAERTYELFTDSYQDAELWVFGLNAARDIANGKIPMKHGESASQKPAYAASEDSTSASSTERHPGGRAPWEPPPPSSMPRFAALGFAEQSAAEFQQQERDRERERASREAATLREQQSSDPFAALDALEELAGPVPELPSAGADQLQAELLREARARVTGGALGSKRSKAEITNAVHGAPPAPPVPAYDPVDPYQRPEQPPLAPMAPADGGIVHSAGGIAPPAGGIAPPAGGIAPPVGGIAPPAGGIAPPAAMAPPAGSAVGSQPFFQREVASAASQAAPPAPAPAPPPPAQAQAAQGEDSDWDEPAPAPPPQMATHAQGASSGGWDSDDDQGAPMPASAAPIPPAQAPMPPSFDTCGAPSRPSQDFVAASKKPQSTGDDLDDLVGEMLGNDSSLIGHGLVDGFHCTGCDFQVMACDEYVWNGDVDYMFFRNNYPTFEKLKKRLVKQADCRAYCCQCSWKSAHASARLEDVAEGLRWRQI